MLDRALIFLDLETTGATAHSDRITEIGLVEVDKGRHIGEWSSLVNPEKPIPALIESLTGITDAMVAKAPTFAQLAHDLYGRLAGKTLVAHNARFDFGFLRNEFRRVGLKYDPEVLCTVRLSRRLFPHERRHNLDSLIERNGLICENRHRALADATTSKSTRPLPTCSRNRNYRLGCRRICSTGFRRHPVCTRSMRRATWLCMWARARIYGLACCRFSAATGSLHGAPAPRSPAWNGMSP